MEQTELTDADGDALTRGLDDSGSASGAGRSGGEVTSGNGRLETQTDDGPMATALDDAGEPDTQPEAEAERDAVDEDEVEVEVDRGGIGDEDEADNDEVDEDEVEDDEVGVDLEVAATGVSAASMAEAAEVLAYDDAAGEERPATTAVKPQVRRVRRVLRKVDPWSVLKLSFFFYVCLFVIIMVASVMLWSAAVASGTIDNIEGFVEDLGFESFEFIGAELFRGALIGGLILIVVGTAFTTLFAVLFNLLSDLVGGVRITTIEQDPGPAPPAAR